MYTVDEDESENIQETRDNDEERQAWCLLAESENEQLQEVISRRDTQKVKKAKVASLLSVENSQKPSSKKFIEVKDRWVEVRVTVNYGAAGHVMPEGLFPRIKFERKTPPKKFAAANGERIKDLREKDFHSKHMQRCAQHSEVRALSNLSLQCRELPELEPSWCWMTRIRTFEMIEMER